MLSYVLTRIGERVVGGVARTIGGERIVKAIGGTIAGALGAPAAAGAAMVTVAPEGAELSLMGYVIIGALMGLIEFVSIYFSPKNTE